MLGVGTATIRQLAHRGALTPARPGARPLRFAEADVWALQQARADASWRRLWAQVWDEVEEA